MPREKPKECAARDLFAANVRRIRLEKAMTQEQLAEKSGLHHNYISSVERRERNISICNIERIALALGVSMATLVSEAAQTSDSAPPTSTAAD